MRDESPLPSRRATFWSLLVGLVLLGGVAYATLDSSDRQIVVGAGTQGAPLGGVVTVQGIDAGYPLTVTGTVTSTPSGIQTVQGQDAGYPVNVRLSEALPTGTATVGKVDQGTGGASAWKTDGSGVTQPVSAASLPLPTGASTSAKQPALGTAGAAATDVLTVQGIASMTAMKVDGSAVTQPVSAASLPLPTGAAAEATLASIKDTAGVKKITDALPTGANTIGKVDQGAAAAASAAWPVNDSGQTSSTYGEVLVATTATAVPTTGLAGRRAVLVQNNGPNEMRCGSNSSVTTSTGIALYANGDSGTFRCSDAACTVYCIAKTANQVSGAASNYFEVK